jgi:hypothetical protein
MPSLRDYASNKEKDTSTTVGGKAPDTDVDEVVAVLTEAKIATTWVHPSNTCWGITNTRNHVL